MPNKKKEKLLTITISKAKNLKTDGHSITGQKIEEFPIFREKCLKIFCIWNTLFIVLFRKNFKYVKFLQNLSFSKLLIKEYKKKKSEELYDKDDVCFKSPYLYLFSRLFFLETPAAEKLNDKININKKSDYNHNFVFKKIDKNIIKLNEVRLLGDLDEIEIPTAQSEFYTDINEYLFDIPNENSEKEIEDARFVINNIESPEQEIKDADNLIKKSEKKIKEASQIIQNSYRANNKFNKFYPVIFKKIWSDLNEGTKKCLFFGLNECYYKNFAQNDFLDFSKPENIEILIKNVLENESNFNEKKKEAQEYNNKEVYNEKSVENDIADNAHNHNFSSSHRNDIKFRDLKIIPFFRSEHRSHIFNFLKFPMEKFDECKKAILALKGITSDDLNRYTNFESLFKFINESKFSLMYIYDVYTAIFDKLFKDIHLKLREVINENENIFLLVIEKNKDFFVPQNNRIKFTKFFKYVLTMKKFEVIKSKILISSICFLFAK